MKTLAVAALLFSSAALVACGKKTPPAAPPAATQAPAPAAPAPAPAVAVQETPAAAPPLTDEQRERAKKQALMDYATMEDKYINDPRAQWASSAKASSTFGDEAGKTPSPSNAAANASGRIDGNAWNNNQQDIGFDWLELGYDKPVAATEVRVVIPGSAGSEAISKVELQDTEGKWATAWSGLSDVKAEQRGSRTWFVRSFDKTATKVKAVKVTFANNVQRGYKQVDAVQLVGD
jgi:hypothetical protein